MVVISALRSQRLTEGIEINQWWSYLRSYIHAYVHTHIPTYVVKNFPNNHPDSHRKLMSLNYTLFFKFVKVYFYST